METTCEDILDTNNFIFEDTAYDIDAIKNFLAENGLQTANTSEIIENLADHLEKQKVTITNGSDKLEMEVEVIDVDDVDNISIMDHNFTNGTAPGTMGPSTANCTARGTMAPLDTATAPGTMESPALEDGELPPSSNPTPPPTPTDIHEDTSANEDNNEDEEDYEQYNPEQPPNPDFTFNLTDQSLDLFRNTCPYKDTKQLVKTMHVTEMKEEHFDKFFDWPIQKLFTMKPFGNNVNDLTQSQKENYTKNILFRSSHLDMPSLLQFLRNTLSFIEKALNPSIPKHYKERTLTNLNKAYILLGKTNMLIEIKCQSLQLGIPLYSYSRTGQCLVDVDYLRYISSINYLSWTRTMIFKEISAYAYIDNRQQFNNCITRLMELTTLIHILTSTYFGFDTVVTFDYLLHKLHGSDLTRKKLQDDTAYLYHCSL